MKKLIFAVVFAALLTAGSSVFAQNNQGGNGSEFYYKNVFVEKIYPYTAGYVVQYRKSITQMATAYLPMEWFAGAAGKGEIITLPIGKAWPSLTVYYKNGEFSHVRLYVHGLASHQTWGNIPLGVNLDDRFEPDGDFRLEF
jgi:hypothetical protein